MELLYLAINILFEIIYYAIFARIIISWLPISKNNLIFLLAYNVSEPMLLPIRDLLKKTPLGKNSMLDFSPIFAILIMRVISGILK